MSERSDKDTSTDAATGVTLVGAVGAAIAGVACCVGPLVVGLLGVGGAGAMVALAPYRPWFLGATVLLLTVGFFLVYRRRPADACGCDDEGPTRKRRTAKVLLWLVTLVVAVVSASPYFIGSAASADASTRDATTAPIERAVAPDARTVRLHVGGMDCAACSVGIRRAMDQVGPYEAFELELESETIRFRYRGDAAMADRFARAIADIGYDVGRPELT